MSIRQEPRSQRPPALSPGLRRYLYATAAVTGAAIMVVEILGARMLTPFVGMSYFVWIAQIAVTLLALAGGYYAGGKLADRAPQLHRLYGALLAAAGYLALTVLACEPVAFWCLRFNLALGSLLASTILFFVPLALLAMTGPFLVRVITSSVSGVGGNVGRLTAVGTLGSFGGTLLIGYVLVPRLSNPAIMCVTALALLLVGAGYFVGVRRRGVVPVALLIGATAAAFAWRQHLADTRVYRLVVERYRCNSHFGRIQVLDRRDGTCRYLLNDNLVQDAYDPRSGLSTAGFTYLLSALPRAYTAELHDVLVIGLGIAVVPMALARAGVRVDTVEINPAVEPIATEFFGFQPGQVHVIDGDGRPYLNRCTNQYDAVIFDAFLGDSAPSHLMTREAFTAVRHVLRPGGTLTVHTFGDLRPGHDFLLASLYRTLRSVFPRVRVHTDGEGSFYLVALNRDAPVVYRPPELVDVHPEAQHEVAAALARSLDGLPADGIVLTDEYNPADYYDAANREVLRRRLAMDAHRM